jgi:hypothetical protein
MSSTSHKGTEQENGASVIVYSVTLTDLLTGSGDHRMNDLQLP